MKRWTWLLLLALVGCSSIDLSNKPPRDWPELEVRVHKEGFMAKRECDGFFGGCAVVDFCAKTCDIYLQWDFNFILEHEKLHCKGYDHYGEKTMRQGWADYKHMFGAEFCALKLYQ
jgi:hypothetical protein